MSDVEGRLAGARSGYAGHTVELEFSVPLSDEDEALRAVVLRRGTAADDGRFTIALGEDVARASIEDARAIVRAPDGAELLDRRLGSLGTGRLKLDVGPATPLSATPVRDLTAEVSPVLLVQVSDEAAPERAGDRLVLLLARRIGPEVRDATPPPAPPPAAATPSPRGSPPRSPPARPCARRRR